MTERQISAETEEWRPAPGLLNYEVSSLGNVRHRLTKRVRKVQKHKKGYLVIDVHVPGHGNKRFTVHGLVCGAFHGPKPQRMECAHGNGDKADNRKDNLRWATAKENAADRDAHGRTCRGTKRRTAKLTKRDVKAILREVAQGRSTLRAIGKKFGVVHSTIYRVKAGYSYKDEARA